MSFCANCGQKNEDNSKFCFNCGSPLDAAQAPVEEAVNNQVWQEEPQTNVTEDVGAPYFDGGDTVAPAETAGAPAVSADAYPPYNEGVYQPPVKKKSKTPIIAAVAVVVVLLVAAAALIFTHTICLFHEYSEPDCEKAAICVYCEKEGESALGHAWTDATCTVPRTCSRCQKTEGDVLPHSWRAATCVAPRICENCSIAEGESLGHDWQGGSCVEAGRCARCGMVAEEPVGHIDGEWVTETAPTLVNNGTEKLFCANCDAVLDVRIVDPKDPAVDGAAFNFTEEEFVEWLETNNGFTIVYSAYDEAYEFSTSGNKYSGYFAFECDADGKVSAIGILADDAATSIGIAMGLAGSIDPVFVYDDDDILAVYNGEYYTDALMTVVYDESEGMCISALAPDELFYE